MDEEPIHFPFFGFIDLEDILGKDLVEKVKLYYCFASQSKNNS